MHIQCTELVWQRKVTLRSQKISIKWLWPVKVTLKVIKRRLKVFRWSCDGVLLKWNKKIAKPPEPVFLNVYIQGRTASWSLEHCAAKAIFYCPTMNSHRPRSQNTAKEQALIPEKDSRRTWPRCHVNLEKSSKNHKPLEKWAKPNLLPDVTPQPGDISGERFRRICHVVESDPPELFAVFSRHSGWPKQGRGRGDWQFDLAH